MVLQAIRNLHLLNYPYSLPVSSAIEPPDCRPWGPMSDEIPLEFLLILLISRWQLRYSVYRSDCKIAIFSGYPKPN
jgi:hypothetical protein